jgi:cobalt transporter subunit CbtA
MTKHLLTSAVFAGLTAGLIAAVLQYFLVVPVLMEGELYETGARIHFSLTGLPESEAGSSMIWADPMRHLGTFAMDLITFTGFALILVAGFAIASRFGHQITQTSGLIWGFAGFAAVHLAPAMGLPPELPGTIAAELAPRQLWWIGCVIFTAAGIASLGYGRGPMWPVVGVALILAPHIMGAPRLDTYFGLGPAELGSLFAARSLGVAAVAWAVMGAVAGRVWSAAA